MRSRQARTFSRKHRRYLAILAGGLCVLCGKELEGNLHADHIHPYSKGGETTLQNGQALCPTCNLQKGDKVMPGTPCLREWQESALNHIKILWREHGTKPLIAACPGSGKTWFSVFASQVAIKERGIQLILVVSPTVNIKNQWCETFEAAGIEAHDSADNESLRFRKDNKLDMLEGKKALCITYAQLAKDAELFEHLALKYKTLFIADEIHHADDNEIFGQKVSAIAEVSHLRLALSGTPFNTNGGALAMCPTVIEYDDEGRKIRKAMPHYTYEYSRAISDNVCRPVEFIKVLGKGTSTYKTLADDRIYQKVVDLTRENKTDIIGPLLDPHGEFFEKMAVDALTSLTSIKKIDGRAGMLVCARNIEHGNQVAKTIQRICKSSSEWDSYSILEIYNDTKGAHDRIKQLDRDNTDIVITVKMISEGIDVKRLRVGLYATDYRTRMFFIQFVGRFIRWETRIDPSQYASIVIPGHIDLIEYAREIELMVDSSYVLGYKDGPPGPGPDQTSIYLGTETEAGEDGLIYRGEEETERQLANAFFVRHPSLIGHVCETLAIRAAKDANMEGSQHFTKTERKTDWSTKNEGKVRAIVKIMQMNGDDDDLQFAKVQSYANKAVGILRKDKMTPVETLKKRYEILHKWHMAMRNGKSWSELHG